MQPQKNQSRKTTIKTPKKKRNRTKNTPARATLQRRLTTLYRDPLADEISKIKEEIAKKEKISKELAIKITSAKALLEETTEKKFSDKIKSLKAEITNLRNSRQVKKDHKITLKEQQITDVESKLEKAKLDISALESEQRDIEQTNTTLQKEIKHIQSLFSNWQIKSVDEQKIVVKYRVTPTSSNRNIDNEKQAILRIYNELENILQGYSQIEASEGLIYLSLDIQKCGDCPITVKTSLDKLRDYILSNTTFSLPEREKLNTLELQLQMDTFTKIASLCQINEKTQEIKELNKDIGDLYFDLTTLEDTQQEYSDLIIAALFLNLQAIDILNGSLQITSSLKLTYLTAIAALLTAQSIRKQTVNVRFEHYNYTIIMLQPIISEALKGLHVISQYSQTIEGKPPSKTFCEQFFGECSTYSIHGTKSFLGLGWQLITHIITNQLLVQLLGTRPTLPERIAISKGTIFNKIKTKVITRHYYATAELIDESANFKYPIKKEPFLIRLVFDTTVKLITATKINQFLFNSNDNLLGFALLCISLGAIEKRLCRDDFASLESSFIPCLTIIFLLTIEARVSLEPVIPQNYSASTLHLAAFLHMSFKLIANCFIAHNTCNEYESLVKNDRKNRYTDSSEDQTSDPKKSTLKAPGQQTSLGSTFS